MSAKPSVLKTWGPILIGLLIALIGGWGFSAIMTQQSFDFYIDLQTQTIHFEFGAVLPLPVDIHEDGRAYVQDVPLRAWLEGQGYLVEWKDGDIYCYKK